MIDLKHEFDIALRLVFFASVITAPTLGYVFMFLDIRATLRRARGLLVHVRAYAASIPSWVSVDSSTAFAALGLSGPCTQEQVLQAYRKRVKILHPDLGGDRQKFLRLQANFEAAMNRVSES